MSSDEQQRNEGSWEPIPQSEGYDGDATAFVQLPPDFMLDGVPLEAPGHGYVPPMITPLQPLTQASADPSATGSWSVHVPTQAEQTQYFDGTEYAEQGGYDGQGGYEGHPGYADHGGYGPGQGGYATGQPGRAEYAEHLDQDPHATAEWRFTETAAPAGPGSTGQWEFPGVPDGSEAGEGAGSAEESGDFAASAVRPYAEAPATLPGGAPAPWALPAEPPVDGGDGAGDPGSAGSARSAGSSVGADAGVPAEAGESGAGPEAGRTAPVPAADGAVGADTAEAFGTSEASEAFEAPGGARAGERVTGGEPTPSGPSLHEAATAPEVSPAASGDPDGAAASEAPDGAAAADGPVAVDGPDGAPSVEPEPGGEAESAEAHAPAVTVPAPAAEPSGASLAASTDSDEHPHTSYTLRVNGADRPVTGSWIGESLLYVLRERLGLAGAKDGCSQGECGACNVQVDGRLVASCLVPAATAAGSEVRTVEGLAVDGEPSDVQRALAACGAVQCGFCIPGMCMTVHDLLEGNHAPTELETRQALAGNLCRCSGYRGVLDAVRDVVSEREASAAATASDTADEPRVPHQIPHPHDGGMA
ncbi:2Fe-2S iron-sulfur cluster-binding protein [Streptomyces sp. NPDC094447]|uniref:2Fe-2S iron-sulfur cluster-binding protein n=1 Tax=Streptomyces sp. NPDC094447 TaxID=3366062 RepID=UPI00381EAE02